MTSLSYMIYQANEQQQLHQHEQQKQFNAKEQSLLSSDADLQQQQQPIRRCESMGTMAPEPPKLRALFRESGILQALTTINDHSDLSHVWENDDDDDSAYEEEEEEVVVVAATATAAAADQALKSVMEEVLTIYEEESDSSNEDDCNDQHVKMCPLDIRFFIQGQEYERTGFYTGPINQQSQMHGNGTFWFTSGDVYLGQFRNGELHGFGIMSMTSTLDGVKKIFKGNFRYNKFLDH